MVTITIPPELERPLNERAKRNGTTAADAAVELVRQGLISPVLSSNGDMTESLRDATLLAIQNGKYSAIAPSTDSLASDRLASQKAAERAIEEKRWSE